jgi:hypothetical protein
MSGAEGTVLGTVEQEMSHSMELITPIAMLALKLGFGAKVMPGQPVRVANPLV